jgi:hypothetical protein
MKKQGEGDQKSDLPGDYNMHLPVDKCRDKGQSDSNEPEKGTSIISDVKTVD